MPPPPTLDLPNAAATAALGAALAETMAAARGGVIYLSGDLGVGKTTLARGFLRALGVRGTVRSPTYTLLEPYEPGGRRILHMDLYRLSDPLELTQLGLADYPPQECLWLIEWPERGAARLPPPDMEVRLQHADGGRRASLHEAGNKAILQQTMARLKKTHQE